MMKEFLEAQGLEYKVVNVQEDHEAAQQLVNETGQMGVPQTKVNGQWVLGFDPKKLMEHVNK